MWLAGIDLADPACFSSETLTRHDVAALISRTTVILCEEWAVTRAAVRVSLQDGRTIERARGDAVRPTDNASTVEQVTTKFRRISVGLLGEGRIKAIIALTKALDRVPDAAQLVAATMPE